MKYIKTYLDLNNNSYEKDGFSYISINDEKDIHKRFEKDIIEYITNINIDFDIINLFIKNNNIKSFCNTLNFNTVLIKIRFYLKGKDYRTPEITNSFYNIVDLVYDNTKMLIDIIIEDKIINFFKQNPNDYIEYVKLGDKFTKRIRDSLKSILIKKKYKI